MIARRSTNIAWIGLLTLALGLLTGCALWSTESWNLERYRDERARDIDSRLSDERPIIKSPF